MQVPENTDFLSSSAADTTDLAAEVQAGNVHRFRELYERLAPSLHAWARVRSRPGQGIVLDADDLLQEVWLRAIEHLASFDATRGSVRAWIFGIAKNVGYEALSERRSAATTGPASTSLGADAWPDMATSIRSRLVRDESATLLIASIEGFDPIDRMMLVHCGLEGIPCTSVAPRLGMSAKTAIKRWERLRARLQHQPFSKLLEV